MICQYRKIPLLKPVPLLRQIGDEDFLRRFVDQFYLRAMDDDLLRPFFAQTRTVRLKKDLINLFTMALQGMPLTNRPRPEAQVESTLEVSRVHCDRIVFHLAAVMETQNIPQCLIAQALMTLAPSAGEVLFTALSRKAEFCPGPQIAE